MWRVIVSLVLVAGVLLLPLGSFPVEATAPEWWDNSWSYRQEIVLGFDTRLPHAVYQPVDIIIVFHDTCWAVDETLHSVRVVCHTKDNALELESQIYDLVSHDSTYITSCSLVFLIPEVADGSERYFVYFNNQETAAVEYPDRVTIEHSSYYYEPIPGYPLISRFFKISQEGFLFYTVSYEGRFLHYYTAQKITKLKPGSTEVTPSNGETVASFDFAYYYGEGMSEYYSTSQELVSSQIRCDGNLMVSCGILSQSSDSSLQTKAIYKYYYCPTPHTRIHAQVTHTALQDCVVHPLTDTDGSYASMQCGGMRSTALSELNFGELYPFIHVYSEHDTIEEFTVDLTPDYSTEDPILHLIQTEDDVNVGKRAWVSFDQGTAGSVHALLLGSTNVVKEGKDERDGLQLKAYESSYPRLPGLEYTFASTQFTRNAYDRTTKKKDTLIPQGFVAEFFGEFFSSPSGGYPLIAEEAEIFQALAMLKPRAGFDFSEMPSEEQTHALTVVVHGAFSVPLGSALSTLTGRRVPYLSVEVYRDTEKVSVGCAARLPLKSSFPSEGFRLLDAVRLLDFRNTSFFKSITFQRLPAGRYLIKVYEDNIRVGGTRRFVGYSIVDLTKDTTTHVFCHRQGSCMVSVVDQNGDPVVGAQVQLIDEGMSIAQNRTDSTGSVMLTAPCGVRRHYDVRVLYQGFEVVNQSIRFSYGRVVIPLRVSFQLDRYAWMIRVIDAWELPAEIVLVPRLTSTAMVAPLVHMAEQQGPEHFEFQNLVAARYTLQIQYKSFVVEKEIQIPSATQTIVFPAVFPVSYRVLDARGQVMSDASVEMRRGGKTSTGRVTDAGLILTVPPGGYHVQVMTNAERIGQRLLQVTGERHVDLVTGQQPLFPLLVLMLGGLMIIVGLAWSILKKDLLFFCLVLSGVLAAVSLVMPWWSLSGSASDVSVSSMLFLIPLNLVTQTISVQVAAGEIAYVPEVFITVMTSSIALMISAGCLVGVCAILKSLLKKRSVIMVLIAALLLIAGCLVVFLVTMSLFLQVGVGSLVGSGSLEYLIPGEETRVVAQCSWGPAIGFYLGVLSNSILLSSLAIVLYQQKKKKQ